MTKIFTFPLKNHHFEDATFVLGAFESFHQGHLSLINQALKNNKTIVLVIFSNPQDLPKNQGKIFTNLNARLQTIANNGIKNILMLKFDDYLANLSGNKFISELINLGASGFIVGKNYRFGKMGSWDAKRLKEVFNNTHIIDFYRIEQNIKLSTTLLKNYLLFGQFEQLNKYLSSNYLIEISCNEEFYFIWDENVIKPNSGVYIIYFVDQKGKQKYPGILHINFSEEEKEQLFLFCQPDFHVGFLEIVKEIRHISSNRFNIIGQQDKEIATNYFIKQQNNN
ncbi:FAD synthase [Mesomycoplasma conjunctivae]|uniref:FAD synthase n=1 Tax=Mesomycoplasma conjunctivae TaxID=45361 RepID=UPI003DA24B41